MQKAKSTMLQETRTPHASYILCQIQGASPRGRLPPPATLAHKELNKMRMTESHKEVHGFRCKLATCKCQELPGPPKQPGRRMYGRNTKDGEKEQCTGKPFALQTASNIFVGQGDFDFFVHFENTASCMYARRHAGASQLRLMAWLSHSSARVCFAACCEG